MNRIVTLLFHDIYRNDPGESGFTGPGADRYKMRVADFERQLRSLRECRQDLPVLFDDLPDAKQAMTPYAITVDDGGLSYYTLMADMLEQYGWRGNCFVTTDQLGKPGFMQRHHVRELHDRGHLIGTHSVSHPPALHHCSWDTMLSEWAVSKAILEDITGSAITIGSVPGGYYSRRVARAARHAGLKVLLTSEPERRLQDIGGCLVAGRYTLRGNAPDNLAGELVGQKTGLLLREWLSWNSKKALKGSLGAGGYARLSAWLAN